MLLGQGVQVEARGPDQKPGRQARHTASLEAPLCCEALPAGQALHAAPVPASQDPGAQALQLRLPADEKNPAGHAEHAAALTAPGDAEKVPLPQGVQASEADPAALRYLPPAHSVQAAAPLAPEYVPAGQGTDDEAPLPPT